MQVQALKASSHFDLPHLARRFFGTLLVSPLTPAEQRIVADLLRPGEMRLFWAQSPADQRHAFETMRRTAIHSDAEAVLRAALLHDVGKAQAELGPVRRSLATVLDRLGGPLPGPMATYRDHGRIGAAALADCGADPLAVDFARRHPDPDPGHHDPEAWRILLAADQV